MWYPLWTQQTWSVLKLSKLYFFKRFNLKRGVIVLCICDKLYKADERRLRERISLKVLLGEV